MADVYDLVQKALTQGQSRGRNQFYNPTADIVMQIPSMIRNMKDVEKTEDNVFLNDMVKVIGNSNNSQSLKNAQQMIDDFNPSDPSIEPGHEFLKNTIATKTDAYNQGKMALQEVSNNIDIYEDYTREEMMSFGTGKVKSIKDLKNEMLRVADLNDKLKNAAASGLKYPGSTHSLERGGRAVEDYYSKLQDTWNALASQDIVTEEEAQAIFMGNFDEVKKDTIQQTDKKITSLDKDIRYWQNLFLKSKQGDESALLSLVEGLELQEGATDAQIGAAYDRLITRAKLEQGQLYKKRNAWSPSPRDDFDKMSLEELEYISIMDATDSERWNALSKEEQQEEIRLHLASLPGGGKYKSDEKSGDKKQESKYMFKRQVLFPIFSQFQSISFQVR